MRQRLIEKLTKCDTAYQIREEWEEVTNLLKSNEIDLEDFTAIRNAKNERLNQIDAIKIQV